MANGFAFKKAVKHDAKLRLALCGPAGSGKTYSALAIATELGGPIAFVDTEHGSASKYADIFAFDVEEPDEFDPRTLVEVIDAAVESGYRVIIIDSLSHYWMGAGGELEQVDAAAKKIQGNSFAAWKTVTPLHNKLVDKLISAPIHVIACMRTKTEWVIVENERGKKEPKKIGLAPVMRDGIEFEFDVCGDLDQDNNLTVTKSRCPALAGKVLNRPGRAMAQELRSWLSGAPATATKPETPTHGARSTETAAAPKTAAPKTSTNFEMLKAFGDIKAQIGTEAYYRILGSHGYEHSNQIPDKKTGTAIYREMVTAVAPSPRVPTKTLTPGELADVEPEVAHA